MQLKGNHQMSYEKMTGPQLAAEYNKIAKVLGKPEVKKFKDRKTALARLSQINALTTRKNSKTKFGTNIVIQLATGVNPRRKGTRAHDVYSKMMSFIEKNGGQATLSDVIAATGYKRPDFDWDLERGNIKKV